MYLLITVESSTEKSKKIQKFILFLFKTNSANSAINKPLYKFNVTAVFADIRDTSLFIW